jgi:peroxiredoxin
MLQNGDYAPELTLPATNGQAVSLDKLIQNGHKVLLVFLRHLG